MQHLQVGPGRQLPVLSLVGKVGVQGDAFQQTRQVHDEHGELVGRALD